MLLPTRIDTDDQQRAEFGLLSPQATVNTIGPHVHPAVFIQASLCHAWYACAQARFNHDTVLAERSLPPGPTHTSGVATSSPVEMPFKYNPGSTDSSVLVLRTYGGTRLFG